MTEDAATKIQAASRRGACSKILYKKGAKDYLSRYYGEGPAYPTGVISTPLVADPILGADVTGGWFKGKVRTSYHRCLEQEYYNGIPVFNSAFANPPSDHCSGEPFVWVKKDPSTLAQFGYMGPSNGFIASPMQLARAPERHAVSKGDRTIFSNSINRELYHKLEQLQENVDCPTHLLSQCILGLLEELRDMNISVSQLERLNGHIDLAVNQYKYNYPKFANMLSLVLHEVIEIYEQNKSDSKVIGLYNRWSFSAKKKMTDDLLGEGEGSKEYITAATLANSGLHAFYIAVLLAKDLCLEKADPKLFGPIYKGYIPDDKRFKLDDNMYYEAKKAYDESFQMVGLEGDPEVFSFCEGTLFLARESMQTKGPDINNFIFEHIANYALVEKPKILIVDTTSSESRNLQLNEKSKKLIIEGKLIVVCWTSENKFLQAHADTMQGGAVTVLGKKNDRVEGILREFEGKSKKDFAISIDQQAIALMQSGPFQIDILYKIAEKHFDNGEFLKTMLKDYITKALNSKGFSDEDIDTCFTVFLISESTSVNRDHCMLLASDYQLGDGSKWNQDLELLQSCEIEGKYSDIIEAYKKVRDDFLRVSTKRCGFGHFEPTYSEMDYLADRLALSATDSIDVRLQFEPFLIEHLKYGLDSTEECLKDKATEMRCRLSSLKEAFSEKGNLNVDEQIECFCLSHFIYEEIFRNPPAKDHLDELEGLFEVLTKKCPNLKGRSQYSLFLKKLYPELVKLRMLSRIDEAIKPESETSLSNLVLQATNLGAAALNTLAKEAGRIEDVDALAALAKEAGRIKDVDASAVFLNELNKRVVQLGEVSDINCIIQNLDDAKFKTLVEKLSNDDPDLFKQVYQHVSNDGSLKRKENTMITVVSSRVSEAYQNTTAYSCFFFNQSQKIANIKRASSISDIKGAINENRTYTFFNGEADGRSSKAARLCLRELTGYTSTS